MWTKVVLGHRSDVLLCRLKGGKAFDYKGARTVEEFTKFATAGYESATSKDIAPAGAAPEKVKIELSS